MKTKVLYQHCKPTGEIFYIGIGSEQRARSSRVRNQYWKRIVDKYGYYVEILERGLTWEEACKKEIALIKLYGRANNNTGILTNMTDGGDGSLGYELTDEHKKILSNRMKSNKNPAKNMSIEHLERITLANQGKRKGHILSEETKQKLSEAKKGEKNYNAKKVLCTETGKIWNTVSSCALDNGLNKATLGRYLKGESRNKTTFKYI